MNNARTSKRRTAIAIVALIAVVALFVVKLVDIQIVQAADLNKDSLGNRSVPVTTYGSRGDIVDTNGVVLADSVDRYDITASPKVALAKDTYSRTIDGVTKTSTFDELLGELADATGTPAATIKAALQKDPNSDFAYIAKGVTLDVRTKVKALKINWVVATVDPSRAYPLGAVAGNLVGFIGTDGPQAGLERSENSCVGATNGKETYERSADYVRLPGSTVTTEPAKDGGTLKLTIDSDFQWFVQQAIAEQAVNIGAKWATAVVVKVSNGHIMAAADYPSVDPNNVNGVSVDDLGSRIFSSPYEPGSTFKAMTAAMLLDAGKITQTTPVTAPGILKVGGGTIKDVFVHGTMHWTTTGVLVNSSNIGISILSEKMSPEDRQAYMKKFGLGQKTEVNFFGESGVAMRDANKWDPITEKAVAFGQGVVATSAQVASIYQTLGNDGVRMPLTLVEGCQMPDGTVTDLPSTTGTQVVSKKAANQVVEMLENVVTQGSLTKVLTIPGYNIAAKTGTAQVAKNGIYGDDRVVSVAGLISGDDPQYAVVVTFGLPTTIKTSAAAAPTFTKIMTQIIKTFRVTPSTKSVPALPATW